MSELMLATVLVAKTTLVFGVALALTRAMHARPAAERHLVWVLAAAAVLALPVLAAVLPSWRVAVPVRVAAAEAGVLAADIPASSVIVQRATSPEPVALVSDAASAAATSAVVEATSSLTTPVFDATSSPVMTPVDAATSSPSAVPEAVLPVEPVRAALSPGALLTLVWLTGALVVGALVLLGFARVRRLARRARPLRDPVLVARARAVAAELGVTRSVRLLEGDVDAMPITFGVLRASLLLPSSARTWTPARQQAVLRHELAHVRRRDSLTQLVAEVACAVHWFNPLAWVAARRLCVEREHACDDAVLAAGARPADYAAELLDIARSMRAQRVASLAAIAMARPSQLRARLQAVLEERQRSARVSPRLLAPAWIAAFVLTVPLAAAVPTLTQAQVPPRPIPPAAPAVPVPAAPAARPDTPDVRLLRPTPYGIPAPAVPHGIVPGTPGSPAPAPYLLPPGSPAPVPYLLPPPPGSPAPAPYLLPPTSPVPGSSLLPQSAPAPAATPVPPWRMLSAPAPPAPGAPQASTPPAPPAPEGVQATCPSGQRATSMSSNTNNDRRTIKWSGPNCSGEVVVEGDVSFDDSFTTITGLSRGGVVRIDVTDGRDDRSLVIRPANGGLSYDYRVGGQRRAWDVSGREWLQAQLLFLFRNAGFMAQDRAAAMLRRGGANAVLGEVEHLRGDYTRAAYLTVAVRDGRLDEAALRRVLGVAGTTFTSDYYRASVITAAAGRYPFTDGLRSAYLDAVSGLGSDYYRHSALTALIEKGELSDAQVAAVVRASGRITSDYYRASLLTDVAGRYGSSSALRPAYLEAAAGISSDYHRAAVLTAALSGTAMRAADLPALVTAATAIKSDYYAHSVLGRIAARDDLDRAALLALIDATAGISSDNYASTVLIDIAKRHALEGEVRERFITAMDRIGSRTYRGRVAEALARR